MWQRTPVARDLEDRGVRHHLGHRRPARAVALRRVAALVEEALGEAADDRRVLVVEGDREAGLADRGEELVELAHVVAWEAHRVVLVGRDLEGADSGVGEFGDALGALALLRRAVERDVDAGDALQRLHLGLEQLDRVDGQGVVEGHVDDGGDAAGGGRDRGVGEAGDALAAPGTDLAVDHAGEDHPARGVDVLRGFRRLAHAQRADHAVAHREEAAFEHTVGEHQVSAHDEVEHRPSPLLAARYAGRS